jgi:hypothetical protein
VIEHPLLFSGPMVRAILEGRKTQTRRVVSDSTSQGNYRASEMQLEHPQVFVDGGPSPAGNPGPYLHVPIDCAAVCKRRKWKPEDCDPHIVDRLYPRYFPGDRLWVRETGWQRPERSPRDMREGADTWAPYYYDADGLTEAEHEQFKEWDFIRRPSIFMPRWASRITLEITKVRCERLKEINGVDAVAEGLIDLGIEGSRWHWDESAKIGHFAPWRAYRALWDSINEKRAPWQSNPWVWVLDFRRRVPQ